MAVKFLDGIDVTGGNIKIANTKQLQFGSSSVAINNDAAGRMYFNASLGYYWATPGSYKMVLDSSGKLGIGTTSPSEKLEVFGGNVLIKNSAATLTIDDIDEEGQSPRIDFNQGGSQNGRIMVQKDSNFVFSTRNLAGNFLPRLFIDGDIGQLQFNAYEATAIANGATAINPNQNFNPSGSRSDTTTDLAIDQGGLVVRTTQEATWELTRAQVDALTTSSAGTTLLSAPGSSNLFIIIEKVTFLIEFVYSGNQMPTNQQYQINQDGNVSDAIAVINGTRINDIAFAGGNSNTSGIYEHDTGFSTLNRTYKPNTATTIRRVNTGALNTAVNTMSIKMRYRVYDTATF